MCDITTNPFEIEDMFRNAIPTEELTDYEADYQLCAIWGKEKSTNLYEIDRELIEVASMPPDYYYADSIYNIIFSPIRLIERSLMYIHQTLLNDTDKIKAQKRTKYEDFYSQMTADNTKYEFKDFMISPRCGLTIDPHLNDDNYKLEPQFYSFKPDPENFVLSEILANGKKLVKVTYNGAEHFGFIDDFGTNPLTNEPQTMRLIKAKLP
jgi:hypothetical protein